MVIQWQNGQYHYPRQWKMKIVATYHTKCLFEFLRLNERVAKLPADGDDAQSGAGAPPLQSQSVV